MAIAGVMSCELLWQVLTVWWKCSCECVLASAELPIELRAEAETAADMTESWESETETYNSKAESWITKMESQKYDELALVDSPLDFNNRVSQYVKAQIQLEL